MFRWLSYGNGEKRFRLLLLRIAEANPGRLLVIVAPSHSAPPAPAADPDSLSTSRSLKRDFFSRREWNFTMENDVFVRYLCFRDADELAKAIQQKQPHKIDVGAVFSAKVRACACRLASLRLCLPAGRPGGARGDTAGVQRGAR